MTLLLSVVVLISKQPIGPKSVMDVGTSSLHSVGIQSSQATIVDNIVVMVASETGLISAPRSSHSNVIVTPREPIEYTSKSPQSAQAQQ